MALICPIVDSSPRLLLPCGRYQTGLALGQVGEGEPGNKQSVFFCHTAAALLTSLVACITICRHSRPLVVLILFSLLSHNFDHLFLVFASCLYLGDKTLFGDWTDFLVFVPGERACNVIDHSDHNDFKITRKLVSCEEFERSGCVNKMLRLLLIHSSSV